MTARRTSLGVLRRRIGTDPGRPLPAVFTNSSFLAGLLVVMALVVDMDTAGSDWNSGYLLKSESRLMLLPTFVTGRKASVDLRFFLGSGDTTDLGSLPFEVGDSTPVGDKTAGGDRTYDGEPDRLSADMTPAVIDEEDGGEPIYQS